MRNYANGNTEKILVKQFEQEKVVINGKEEFLDIVFPLSHYDISEAIIIVCTQKENSLVTKKIFKLKSNFSIKDYFEFLNNLNFEYDNEQGIMSIYGLVIFYDNTWLEREICDAGVERWAHYSRPEIGDYERMFKYIYNKEE